MTTGPDANGWTKIAEADKSAGPAEISDWAEKMAAWIVDDSTDATRIIQKLEIPQ